METMPRPRTPAAVVLLATVVFGSSTASACLHLQTSFGAARCCTAQHHAAKPCHGGRSAEGRALLCCAAHRAPALGASTVSLAAPPLVAVAVIDAPAEFPAGRPLETRVPAAHGPPGVSLLAQRSSFLL
jgi:hypothetical protein